MIKCSNYEPGKEVLSSCSMAVTKAAYERKHLIEGVLTVPEGQSVTMGSECVWS